MSSKVKVINVLSLQPRTHVELSNRSLSNTFNKIWELQWPLSSLTNQRQRISEVNSPLNI